MDDYLVLAESMFQQPLVYRIPLSIGGILLGWFLYVPLHEFAHVWGCQLAGGEVSRLDLSPLYGAVWLQQWFPYVHVGSDYAGQLSGFDTFGNDGIYLSTVLFPYILTLFPGVYLYQKWAELSDSKPIALFSAATLVSLVYAPFISITGDFYEFTSIVVSRCYGLFNPSADINRWRSDDFFLLIRQLQTAEGGMNLTDLVALSVGITLSVVAAFLCYGIAVVLSQKLIQRRKN